MREALSDALPEEVMAEDPVPFCAAEVQSGEAVGILAVAEDDSDWEILYIEVFSRYQRKGIGRAKRKQYEKSVKDRKLGALFDPVKEAEKEEAERKKREEERIKEAKKKGVKNKS